MTKIQAIVQLIIDNGGKANWETIYNNIDKYYPNAKKSKKWKEGLRGVLYRGIDNNQIVKICLGEFSIPNQQKQNFVEDNIFPEIDNIDSLIEGAKITINVNKFERNYIARKNCIEVNGCYCHICGLNFEDKYGEIGKNFIHVHHKIPLSKINKEYVVNPVNDLIPVCPNCHAMLHRKVNGKYLSIEELRNIIKT